MLGSDSEQRVTTKGEWVLPITNYNSRRISAIILIVTFVCNMMNTVNVIINEGERRRERVISSDRPTEMLAG